MDDFYEFWRWVKTFAGIVLLVLVSLYFMRSLMTLHFLTIDQFDRYCRGLWHYIFA